MCSEAVKTSLSSERCFDAFCGNRDAFRLNPLIDLSQPRLRVRRLADVNFGSVKWCLIAGVVRVEALRT